MGARLFGIAASVVLLALASVAMVSGRRAKDKKEASAIVPGETSPHEERGFCVACHLIGGPGGKRSGAAVADNGAALPALQAGDTAATTGPAIGPDQVRPHGERGPCTNCHTVVTGPTAASYAAPAPAVAMASPYVNIVQPGPLVPDGFGMAAIPYGTAEAFSGVPYGVPGSYAAGGAPTFVPSNQPFVPQASPAAPPPLAEGAIAPHGDRGMCTTCHMIMRAQASAGWQPQALMPQAANQGGMRAAQNVGEAEALGMAVRPTSGEVRGMLVVEVEGMARRAGLELGDIIRAIDGQVTTNLDGFIKTTRGADPTRGVLLDVVRDGKGLVLVMR
jgi:hypothetical protein